jgi:hypothetical protein
MSISGRQNTLRRLYVEESLICLRHEKSNWIVSIGEKEITEMGDI